VTGQTAGWRRACGASACVEVDTSDPAGVRVRDSKDPDGPTLLFTREEWRLFLRAARDGHFDPDPDR
jgi:hypothetical protein